jgi:hypothetical protein
MPGSGAAATPICRRPGRVGNLTKVILDAKLDVMIVVSNVHRVLTSFAMFQALTTGGRDPGAVCGLLQALCDHALTGLCVTTCGDDDQARP